MHFLTSNFNLLSTNLNWNLIKYKKDIIVDNKYNNILISLNDKKNLLEFNTFHIILYIDKNNLTTFKSLYKEIDKKTLLNKNKTFFLYLIINDFNNLIDEKFILSEIFKLLNKSSLSKNKNFFLHYLNINSIDKKFLNQRNENFLRFPFDISFIKKISKIILKNIHIYNAKPYKLIILDCDNTLWGGILDEDGLGNIKYGGDDNGAIYLNFQKRLLSLKKQGFILSISSKNNEKKVWQAMKYRKMILQKKDFINPKINWEDKGLNIKNIIQELSLRASDCIFIDDNLVEIKKVKNVLKNLNVIHLDDESKIFQKLEKDFRFQKTKILKEDIKKYKQYKIKSDYEKIAKKNDNDFNFFKSLKQKIKVLNCKSNNFDRTLQLFNKTNQFNFNLNRYSVSSLKKIRQNKNYDIKLISFSDKFGDHGLVGAYIIKKNKDKLEIIDFVLSCRVLNRFVEDFFINIILTIYKSNKYIIYYKKTSVNKELISKFLKKNFFTYKNKKSNKYIYEIKKNKKFKEISKIFK